MKVSINPIAQQRTQQKQNNPNFGIKVDVNSFREVTGFLAKKGVNAEALEKFLKEADELLPGDNQVLRIGDNSNNTTEFALSLDSSNSMNIFNNITYSKHVFEKEGKGFLERMTAAMRGVIAECTEKLTQRADKVTPVLDAFKKEGLEADIYTSHPIISDVNLENIQRAALILAPYKNKVKVSMDLSRQRTPHITVRDIAGKKQPLSLELSQLSSKSKTSSYVRRIKGQYDDATIAARQERAKKATVTTATNRATNKTGKASLDAVLSQFA